MSGRMALGPEAPGEPAHAARAPGALDTTTARLGFVDPLRIGRSIWALTRLEDTHRLLAELGPSLLDAEVLACRLPSPASGRRSRPPCSTRRSWPALAIYVCEACSARLSPLCRPYRARRLRGASGAGNPGHPSSDGAIAAVAPACATRSTARRAGLFQMPGKGRWPRGRAVRACRRRRRRAPRGPVGPQHILLPAVPSAQPQAPTLCGRSHGRRIEQNCLVDTGWAGWTDPAKLVCCAECIVRSRDDAGDRRSAPGVERRRGNRRDDFLLENEKPSPPAPQSRK